MELQSPASIPVEKSFNEFVKSYGGELISELMPENEDLPRNADYLFRNEMIISEMKCLEKDLFNSDEDVERLITLIQTWTKSGKITGHKAVRWVLGQEKLNEECYKDLIKLARRTIETAIRSAKKQIQSSKEYFNIPQAKGLLLIANDGNNFLEHQNFYRLILDIMIKNFMDSSIDGFVYFTANMPVRLPDETREMNIWIPGYRKENDDHLVKFVNVLGEKWYNFYMDKIGEETKPIKQLKTLQEAKHTLSAMQLIRENKKWKL